MLLFVEDYFFEKKLIIVLKVVIYDVIYMISGDVFFILEIVLLGVVIWNKYMYYVICNNI